MITSRLTSLQRDLLEAFFRRESRFFLTGGAALARYHLGHRETADLDLFTTSDLLTSGQAALQGAVAVLGASIERLRTAPDFHRQLVHRGCDAVVVDLLHDRAPQGRQPKMGFGAIRVDPPNEILANKLCTLLSRAEDALRLAMQKDGGLTPAQLAWVLSQITLGEDARIPGGLPVEELRAFVADLIARLTRLAFPEARPPNHPC